MLPDHGPDPVNTRDADRAESSLCLLKLVSQLNVPACWEEHILLDENNEITCTAIDSEMGALRGCRAVLDERNLVVRVRSEAWRGRQVRLKNLVVRLACNE